jgi:hypothetical protein
MNEVHPGMEIILFGATGMVGQGVLRECLLDLDVETVLAVGRSPTGQQHAKLREIVHDNFLDYSAIESQLTGFDACFFCLGVSSVGMGEQRYRHLTYDITLAGDDTGKTQSEHVFIYASGAARLSTEQARTRDVRRGQGKTGTICSSCRSRRPICFARQHQLHGVRSESPGFRRSMSRPAPLLSYLTASHRNT